MSWVCFKKERNEQIQQVPHRANYVYIQKLVLITDRLEPFKLLEVHICFMISLLLAWLQRKRKKTGNSHSDLLTSSAHWCFDWFWSADFHHALSSTYEPEIPEVPIRVICMDSNNVRTCEQGVLNVRKFTSFSPVITSKPTVQRNANIIAHMVRGWPRSHPF
jgi:hypothetical protein